MIEGAVVSDIGTDHAYLPLYLIRNGLCSRVYASDIASGPISRAAQSIRGFEDRIFLSVGDGLNAVPEQETDCIVIAGMGGDTIEHIIEACGWSFDGKVLILQAMSKIPELRKWLWERGFDVTDERLSEDSGMLYRAMKAVKRPGPSPETWELLAGKCLFDRRDPLLNRWIDNCIEKLERAVAGMKSGEIEPPRHYIDALKELKERRSELD